MTALRPTWFVVVTRPHGENGEIYYDLLPDIPKGAAPRAYTIRLDTLPNAEKWCARSIRELMASYYRLKGEAKLPTTARPVAAPAEKPTAKLGHREMLAARPWGDRPADPWVDPDSVKAKPEHWIVPLENMDG